MDGYGELYWDKKPAQYAHYAWTRCLAWWDSISKSVQEDYDMAMGLDSYMEHKGSLGYSNLVVPLIYVVAEARLATYWEMLSRDEPFFRVRPIDEDDSWARVAAERKQDAIQTLRRTLDWNSVMLELFQACEFSSHAWTPIEIESRPIGPTHNLLVPRDMYGAERDYVTFCVNSPGQVLVDGFYRDDRLSPVKVKLAFKPWHELLHDYGEYIKNGDELQKHAKPRDDSAFYNPNDAKMRSQSGSLALRWTRSSGAVSDSGKGFLVAEMHIQAMHSDGKVYKKIYTFLPEVTAVENPHGESASFGYPLCPPGGVDFPYGSVDDLLPMARARKLPYSMTGKSTAELLYSMQRERSDALATGRDLDRRSLQPDMIIRPNMLIGTEDPEQGVGTVWQVNETEDSDRQVSLDNILRVVNFPTPNRAWLAQSGQEIQGLAELIGAAMEATTGGDVGPDEKVGIFKGRARGAAGRLNLVFSAHADHLVRNVDAIMNVMAELGDEMLYPPIKARSKTFGRPTPFMAEDITSETETYIPMLNQFALQQESQLIWQSLGEVLARNPIFNASPEALILLAEDVLTHNRIGEQRVQQYVQAMQQGAAMAMQPALPPEIGGQPMNGGASPKLAQLMSANQVGVS